MQLAQLVDAGADAGRIFTDKISGAAGSLRPGLASLLDYARPGDTVVVTAIDRLGRSVVEITRTIADLGEREITLRALREESIPPPPPVALWLPSWRRSPSWNSNSVGNGEPLLDKLDASAAYLPPSHPNSALSGKNSCAVSQRQANPYANWQQPSASAEPRPTATSASRSRHEKTRPQ